MAGEEVPEIAEKDEASIELDFAFFEDAPDEAQSAKPGAASRRKQRRQERASVRAAHEKAQTRELRAVFEVLQALPEALPGLASKSSKEEGGAGYPEKRPGRKREAPEESEVQAALLEVEEKLRTDRPYGSLKEAFGPSGGFDVLAAMVDRPPKYQQKHLAQELSILAKVWALAAASRGQGGLAVVDIGAGNGSLALLAAMILGGHAVLVDHTLPPEPLRVEDKVPEPYRSHVLRVTGDVADLDASGELEPILAKHNISQVVVIAKHLCGVGTDLALRLVRRWCQGAGGEARVKVLGAVMATCCGHKIGKDDRHIYAGIHQDDQYLQSLTDGNQDHLLQFLSICTRCVAWRTTAGALANRISSSQVRTAELFEDALQQPRLNLLKKLFPAATEVAFVPQSQSPQNRCLIAGSEAGVQRAASGEAKDDADALAAMVRARDKLLSVNGGALDLRPHGFVSTRFDYDGT